jgi:hypothetical protein
LLLVDVNNIHVSSVNHGFDPLDYLRALPAHRVQQIHLAGHSDNGTHMVDTHDHPVAPAVWALYAQACQMWGSPLRGTVPAMIERDAHIPPLAELLDEMAIARRIAAQPSVFLASVAAEKNLTAQRAPEAEATAVTAATLATSASVTSDAGGLLALQRGLARFMLSEPPEDLSCPGHVPNAASTQTQNQKPTQKPNQPDPWPERQAVSPWVCDGVDWTRHDRLGIYHHAYRARLAEVLGESLAKTQLYMGSDAFEVQARAYAVAHPPLQRSLNRYGAGFPDFLGVVFPANPELHELAQLDWDLRTCFDGVDAPALDAATAQVDARMGWLSRSNPLHPSVGLRPITTNVVQLWKAMDDDADVPPAVALDAPAWVVVWRKGLQPHFQTVDAAQAQALRQLGEGFAIQDVAQTLAQDAALADPQRLAIWLSGWLHNGWLAAA